MDLQHLFNIFVSIAGFLAVFVFNQYTRKIQKLEDKQEDMPLLYVQKLDYKEDIKEVKDILRQIFEKLDNKADKV